MSVICALPSDRFDQALGLSQTTELTSASLFLKRREIRPRRTSAWPAVKFDLGLVLFFLTCVIANQRFAVIALGILLRAW